MTMSLFNRVLPVPLPSDQAGLDSPPQPPSSGSPSVNTQNQQIFQYKKLEVGEIRLVTILSGAGNQPMRCSISTHVLDSVAGSYEALSYTWGSGIEKERIYLDDGLSHLPVTKNCAAAMRRLRLPYQIRVVWIDAICINQADILERNEQVSIMATIFKTAFQVLIHIGESDRTSNQTMQLLLRIENHEVTYDQPLTPDDHQALQALLRRPWFSRVWVLQEIYMSRKALLFCGPYCVSWESIQILRGFERLATPRLAGFERLAASPSGRWPYVTTIKDRATFSIQIHLYQLLTETRDCHATDPRDKLFALLNMFPDADRYQLRVDYSVALVHVLQKVAMQIARYKGLNFLSAIQGRSHVPGLPSWVPDWTTPSIRATLYPLKMTNQPQFDAGPSWMEARGKQLPAWKLSDMLHKRFPQVPLGSLAQHLHAFGFHLGKIDLLGTIELENMQWTDILGRCNQAASSVPQSHFLQSLRARHDPAARKAKYSLLYYMIAELSHSRLFELQLEGNPNYTRVFEAENEDSAWRERVESVMNRRQFFTTADGYFGFAPAEAEIGDTAYILASGPVPYIVREAHCYHVEPTAPAKAALTYSFVGEAYVAGVMDGDFIHGVGTARYTDIILC